MTFKRSLIFLFTKQNRYTMQYSKRQTAFFILLFSLFSGPLSISAQGYGMAAGLRVGNGIGITYQHQIALNTSLEGILQREVTGSYSDVTGTILYEKHQNVLTKGLNMYAGGGLYYTWLSDRTNLINKPTNPIGISPIAGAELTIQNFNVSIDFKPNIKLAGGGDGISWFQMQSAFSIRYVLAGRFYKNEEWKFWKKWFKKK
jgi:hypothetical protein